MLYFKALSNMFTEGCTSKHREIRPLNVIRNSVEYITTENGS